MAIKAYVIANTITLNDQDHRFEIIGGQFLNTSNGMVESTISSTDVYFSEALTKNQIVTKLEELIVAEAAGKSYSEFTALDIEWIGLPKAEVLAKSFATPARSLNSAYQISATRDAWVNYSVDILCSLSLTSGQQGTLYLEYADDSGFTTNVKEVARYVNGNTGTLTIGLGLTQNSTAPVGGLIPAGKYVKLRTQNNTGTPTFTFRSSQEVLL